MGVRGPSPPLFFARAEAAFGGKGESGARIGTKNGTFSLGQSGGDNLYPHLLLTL
jgi:hypothetical protein